MFCYSPWRFLRENIFLFISRLLAFCCCCCGFWTIGSRPGTSECFNNHFLVRKTVGKTKTYWKLPTLKAFCWNWCCTLHFKILHIDIDFRYCKGNDEITFYFELTSFKFTFRSHTQMKKEKQKATTTTTTTKTATTEHYFNWLHLCTRSHA